MKSTKRILGLLLAAVLLFGIVACAGDSGTPSGSTDSGTSSDTGSTSTDTSSGGDDSSDAGDGGDSGYERVTITYSCPQVVEGYDYNAPNGDGYSNFILDKFNIDFQGINVPWGEWSNIHATWIMAQDMPDVMIYNYGQSTHSNAQEFVKQNLIRRLPDDWKARWPGVADVVGKTTLGPMLEDLYGGTYFLPRARFYHNLDMMGSPLANHWSLWTRADWVTAVGGEDKNNYTILEVMDLARKIKEQDPGGIGPGLVPITMDVENSAHFFLRAHSTYWDDFYTDANGVYQWGAAHPATLEGLKLWYEAFTEGLLDPEFYALTFEQDMEKFQTLGIAGFCYLGGQNEASERFRVDYRDYSGGNMDDIGLATLLGADGYYHQQDLINFWGAVCFSPTADEAKVERWMDLMEFTSSPEGNPGTSLGIKGVDWDYDANGDLISLVEPGTLLAGPVGEAKYPSLGHVLGSIILWDDTSINNPNTAPQYRAETRALMQNRSTLSTPETFVYRDWNLWTSDSENLLRARNIDYRNDYANLITRATSEANLVELYEQWMADQMPLIQPVLDEFNG